MPVAGLVPIASTAFDSALCSCLPRSVGLGQFDGELSQELSRGVDSVRWLAQSRAQFEGSIQLCNASLAELCFRSFQA